MKAFIEQLDTPDILALFGGVLTTTALVAVVFLLEDVRDIALTALVAQGMLIYQFFFTKRNGVHAPPPAGEPPVEDTNT